MKNFINNIIFFIFSCFVISTGVANSNMQIKQWSTNQVLSPDGKWIAYIKKSKYIVPSDCFYPVSKGEHGDEIWIVNLKTMTHRLLVANHFSCGDVTKVIPDPQHLEFSPDSKTLYFETSAWVVSGAIHAVDVDGKNLRFVTDGNDYRIITNEPYRGDLVVNQHRYHEIPGDGSYDWDWLFTPAGKQIKLYQIQA